MADKIKTAIKVASPTAGIGLTLAELRDKKKKGDFQKGDYSDIDSDETITLELKEKSMEAPKNPNSKLKFKSMQAPPRNDNSVEMPKFKRKKTTEVPKYPKELKSGGRAGYSVGGKAIKGVSKILLKK